jgi:transposase
MVMKVQGQEAKIERVDDISLIYGMIREMGIRKIVDSQIKPHGNWEGISPGWVITIWLVHIISEKNHSMEPVQEWVRKRITLLRGLTHQAVRELDRADDRLASCLNYLQASKVWEKIEQELGVRVIRVYELPTAVVRVDATVGSVSHDPAQHTLFQVGKAKNGLYETQFKMMMASLDALGLAMAVDVVAGNRADDGLYIPRYQRIKEIVKRAGVMVVGDSKMSATLTRTRIGQGKDYYLTPLAHEKDEPGLLDELLTGLQGSAEATSLIFLPEDLPQAGEEADASQACARGYERRRTHQVVVAGQLVEWEERLLVVRSFSYSQTMQAGLLRRLARAEAELCALTPARQRGKQQYTEEASLLAAVERISQHYRVQGFFQISYTQEVKARSIRAYKGRPARCERKVRFQLSLTRNQEVIDQALLRAGWRIYATNAPQEKLALAAAVATYRDQYIEENIFRRLQGKFLSINTYAKTLTKKG